MEIIETARDGTVDYDFQSLVFIAGGGQGLVSSIKSNIDGKIYVVKKLETLNVNKSRQDISEAEREVNALRSLSHPLIPEIIDIVKDQTDCPCIIMQKCE